MISADKMMQSVTRFQQICLTHYPKDIDTLNQEQRIGRIGNEFSSDLPRQLLGDKAGDVIWDICRLAKTPRLLKLILRRTYRAWEALHGEIDFDDLLVANVIRFSAPEAFDFILENIQEIRGLEIKSEFEKHEERLDAIEAKWDQAIESCRWDRTSVKKLIKFLFPAWNIGSPSGLHLAPQGLHVASPTDYWSRFLSEEIQANEIRDQEVISSLAFWRKNPDGSHFQEYSLSKVLAINKEFSSKLEQFAPLFLDGQDFRRLASQLFYEATKLNGVYASSDSVPGFIPLWRCTIRQPIDNDEHHQWVQNEISKALPLSFHFANDIYYYYRTNRQSEINGEKDLAELRNKIILDFKDLFVEDPGKFAKSIDPKYMYSSHHFCVFYSSKEEGGPGFKAEEWTWFAQLLLKAGALEKQVIIPQLVGLLVKERRRIIDFICSFSHSMANELFAEKIPELMALLVNDINLENFTDREVAQFMCAHEAANQWMMQNSAEN